MSTDKAHARWTKIIPKKLEKLEESKEFQIKPKNKNDIDIFIIELTPISGLHKDQKYLLEFHTTYVKNNKIMYFPFNPPKVKFISNMHHSNIYKNGDICLDILKENWSPSYNFDTVLNSIINLLENPNPNSAANGVAGKQEKQYTLEYEGYLKSSPSLSETERDLIKRKFFAEYIKDIKRNNDANEIIYQQYAHYFE
jgi:ubiquitin-protein ligase